MSYDNKLAIVIPAYDGNLDIFKEYLRYFKIFWEDCPFELILVTQDTRYTDERVTSLTTNKEALWTARVLKALEYTKCKYILTSIEDAFISKKINTDYIYMILDFMEKNHIKYYRNPKNGHKKTRKNSFNDFDNACKIRKDIVYSRSLGIDIWERDTLLQLFADGTKNAWQIEEYFLEQAYSEKKGYFDDWVSDKDNFLNVIETVNKGKWIPSAIKKFKKIGYPIDLGNRKVMPLSEVFKLNFRFWIGKVIPIKFRKKIKKILTKFGFKFAINN